MTARAHTHSHLQYTFTLTIPLTHSHTHTDAQRRTRRGKLGYGGLGGGQHGQHTLSLSLSLSRSLARAHTNIGPTGSPWVSRGQTLSRTGIGLFTPTHTHTPPRAKGNQVQVCRAKNGGRAIRVASCALCRVVQQTKLHGGWGRSTPRRALACPASVDWCDGVGMMP